MKHEANNQVAPQLGFATVASERFLPGDDRLRRRATAGCPAADNALYAVARHEIQSTLAGADDRLPAVHRAAHRPRNQCYLLELIAPVGHARGNGVVLAAVGKGRFVEGLEDDFELLFEQLAI